MSVTSAPSASSQSSQQLVGYAALKAARAQYMKTGIDKDAGVGDPDHDGSAKSSQPASASASAPAAAPAAAASSGAAGSKVNILA